MSWLRNIWQRLLPAKSSTSFGDTIQRMAAASDPDERVRLAQLLARQLESAFEGSADNYQVGLWQLGERMRQGQGETNDMISEAVNLVRGQGAELRAARAEFREGLETVGERVSGVEATQIEHGQRITSTEQRLDRSEADRVDLRQQSQETRGAVDALANEFRSFRDEIRALVASARPPKEVERLVDMIERHERELTARREADNRDT